MRPTYKGTFLLSGEGRVATVSAPRDLTIEEAEEIAEILIAMAKRSASLATRQAS
jgi:hypothetical protein